MKKILILILMINSPLMMWTQSIVDFSKLDSIEKQNLFCSESLKIIKGNIIVRDRYISLNALPQQAKLLWTEPNQELYFVESQVATHGWLILNDAIKRKVYFSKESIYIYDTEKSSKLYENVLNCGFDVFVWTNCGFDSPFYDCDQNVLRFTRKRWFRIQMMELNLNNGLLKRIH